MCTETQNLSLSLFCALVPPSHTFLPIHPHQNIHHRHQHDTKQTKKKHQQTYDIVISTYQVLARDFKASASAASSSSGGGGKQLAIAAPARRKGLLAVPWRRVILDEVNRIYFKTRLIDRSIDRRTPFLSWFGGGECEPRI